MTKIRPDSPVVRETDLSERGDALVIMLGREAHSVDYGTILDFIRKRDYQRGLRKGA